MITSLYLNTIIMYDNNIISYQLKFYHVEEYLFT